MEAYLPLIILIGISIAIALLMSLMSTYLGPKRPGKKKMMPYESGMDPYGNARDRFTIKFYLIAMLFVVFDIEIVFMYPWAMTLNTTGLAVFAFIEMITFIVILFVGYIYVYKKGGLEWDSRKI